MSRSELFESTEPSLETALPAKRKKSLPPWLLPTFLVGGFAAIFTIVFADRLLPARAVRVSPAVLLTELEEPEITTSNDSTSNSASPNESALDFSSPMLFQAAGWFEPDPLPIRATALVDGVVAEVHVLEGEAVEKGQPLATLITEDAELILEESKRSMEQVVAEHHMHLAHIPAVQAEAASALEQIAASQAQLEEINDRYARIQTLSEGTVSEQQINSARLSVKAQEAQLSALKSDHKAILARLDGINTQSQVFDARIAAANINIAENELALARTRITSPVTGVVLELKASPGQKKLLRMDDPDSATIAVLFETGKLQARVDVPLADARELAPQQPAIVTSDFLPNKEFQGVVSRIVGSADLQRNTLQAKVRIIDPDPRLRPEMLCRVKFLEVEYLHLQQQQTTKSTRPSGNRAVMAPEHALVIRDGRQASIWVASPDNKTALLKSIEIGNVRIDDHIAIESGVLAGELIILPPHAGLNAGRRIQIQSQTSPR